MEPHGVPLRLARAIPVHAEPRQDAVCADARKTPSQGDRGVFANRSRTAETANLAAQGQVVSRKTVAEVPLTGLSFKGLEDGSVALAAQRRPEKQIAAIWDVFYEIDASIGRGEASVASDFQLHQRIVEATCNPSFDDFMNSLVPWLLRGRPFTFNCVRPTSRYFTPRCFRQRTSKLSRRSSGRIFLPREAMCIHLVDGRQRYRRLQAAASN